MLDAMRSRRVFSGAPTVAVAAVGVIVGHWIAYSLVYPGPRVRQAILAASGHGYWHLAVELAVVLGVSALGTVVFRLFGDRDADEPSRSSAVVGLAQRLIVLQLVAFAAMELVERAAAGAPVGDMFFHSLFVVGLSVQVLVAVAGAFVLLCFARTVVATLRRLRGAATRRLPAVRLRPPAASGEARRVLVRSASPRGPPSSPRLVSRSRSDAAAAA